MDDRLVATSDPSTQVNRPDLLRTAAEALRYRARETPRGPWRWAEPDLDRTEPLMDAGQQWRPPHNVPLEAVEAAAVPQPAHRVRADLIDPEIAAALATLLELVAESLENDGRDSTEATGRAAVAVARCVLQATAPSMAT